MNDEDYNYIMTFTSHNRAMYIYNQLRKRIKIKLVNSPNKINISCTQAIKFKESDMEIIKHQVEINNIYPTSVYKITGQGINEQYILVD